MPFRDEREADITWTNSDGAHNLMYKSWVDLGSYLVGVGSVALASAPRWRIQWRSPSSRAALGRSRDVHRVSILSDVTPFSILFAST